MEPVKPYPNIKESIVLIISGLSAVLLMAGPVYLLKDHISNTFKIFFSLLIYQLIFFIVSYWMVSRKYKYPCKKLIINKIVNYKVIIYSILTIFGLFMISSGVLSFIEIPDWGMLEAINEIKDNPAGRFLFIIGAVIIAPVSEEIIIRGFLLRGLIGNYTQKTALLLSSMIFSFIHFNPIQMLPAFLIGMFFGWLFIRLRNILICIYLHSFYNGFLIYLFFSIDYEKMSQSAERIDFNNPAFVIQGIFIIIMGVSLAYTCINRIVKEISKDANYNIFIDNDEYYELKKDLFENNLIGSQIQKEDLS